MCGNYTERNCPEFCAEFSKGLLLVPNNSRLHEDETASEVRHFTLFEVNLRCRNAMYMSLYYNIKSDVIVDCEAYVSHSNINH
jgi:hypothetical protein